jgi:hypothetical protein
MPSNLRNSLIKKVFGGRGNPLSTIVVTATGTGRGAVNYKVGEFCLDSSSGNFFLCTATAGSGTWVQVNA